MSLLPPEPLYAWPGEAPPPPPVPREDGLGRAAQILVAIWAVSVVVLGAPAVFTDSFSGGETRLSLDLVSFVVFAMGLNVWLVALVLGLISIGRSRGRRAVRAALFVVLLLGGVVGPFVLSGWTLGDGGDDDLVPRHMPLRGLGIWITAAIVVVVVSRLLRVSLRSQRADRPRTAIVLRSAAALVGIAVLLFWLHYSAAPTVTVKNDTAQTLDVQLCPAQECGDGGTAVKPGKQSRFRLSSHADPVTPDSLRLTAGARLFGCMLVDREPPAPKHLVVDATSADLETC